mgnify:FL=1
MSPSSYRSKQWTNDFKQLMDQLEHIDSDHLKSSNHAAYELIHQENKLRLFRYLPLDVPQKNTPILCVYALINRPYILDIVPERSLVLRLLKQGYPVYLVDWGYPDASDCLTSLNDYINGLLYRCVQQVKRHSDVQKIDLLGICQGGVFSLCYTALHPNCIRQLITLVTPVDFQIKENTVEQWGKNAFIDQEPSHHNIPGQALTLLFKTLKPFQLNREKYRKLDQLIHDKKQLNFFLKMEKWINDSPDLAGKAADEFGRSFYQKNQLHLKTLRLGDVAVLLENIRCPVLNIYATYDHIVAPQSSAALQQHISPKLYQEFKLEGGHIGAFINKATQQVLVNRVDAWLSAVN